MDQNVLNDYHSRVAARLGSETMTRIFAETELARAATGQVAAFQMLADCIRSGQVSDDRVASIMAENPEFSGWYRSVHPAPAST